MYEACSFYLWWKNYIQIDGVATGLPLGSLLVNIFVTSLEEALLSSIKKHAAHWTRYINDTHVYIDLSKTEFVLEKLNSYHYNIQFTHKIEENQKITFLEVLTARTRDNKLLETTVFRKETNADLYINWNSHAPIQWKRGSLKNLVHRSISICSNEKLLDVLNYLRNAFIKTND